MSDVSPVQKSPASTLLFRQGATAKSVTLVESGWIKLVRIEQDGQEQITALHPPGSLLGAETLISNLYYSASAITMTNCQFYQIPAPTFLRWIRTDPQFSWQIHRALSQRISARDIYSAQSRAVPSRLRLEQLLWQLLWAQNNNETDAQDEWWNRESKIFLPLQRQELAQMISVTPEYLSRLLRRMERDGTIRRDNGWLVVPRPHELWRAPEINTLTNFNLIQSEEPGLANVIIA